LALYSQQSLAFIFSESVEFNDPTCLERRLNRAIAQVKQHQNTRARSVAKSTCYPVPSSAKHYIISIGYHNTATVFVEITCLLLLN